MNAKLSSAFVAATLIASFALGAPVHAQSASSSAHDQVTEVVKFDDLDLSSAQGIRTLHGRIRIAAWHVCLQLVDSPTGPNGIERVRCQRGIVEAAVTRVNLPALTAFDSGKKTAGQLTAAR